MAEGDDGAAECIGECSIRRLVHRADLFPHATSEIPSISTPVSLLGSVFVAFVMAVMGAGNFLTYLRKETTISRESSRRALATARIASPFGIITAKDGTPFYNESFFKWRFRYRCIFHGDTQNDQDGFARQYHSLPATSCKVYYDVFDGVGSMRLLLNISGGKMAEMGCIDLDAAKSILETKVSKGVLALRPELYLIGKYGEPEYWFVQADLETCLPGPNGEEGYGKSSNISCASPLEFEALFSKHDMTLDVVGLDTIAPKGTPIWNNLYTNFDERNFGAVEIFFRSIVYSTKDHNYTTVFSPIRTEHLIFDSRYFRSRRRLFGNLYSVYIRLADMEEKIVESAFSLENVFENIGAWQAFLWILIGFLCTWGNRALRTVRLFRCGSGGREQQRLEKLEIKQLDAVAIDVADAKSQGKELEQELANLSKQSQDFARRLAAIECQWRDNLRLSDGTRLSL